MNYFVGTFIFIMFVGCSGGSMKFKDSDKYKQWYNKKEKESAKKEHKEPKLIEWEPMK